MYLRKAKITLALFGAIFTLIAILEYYHKSHFSAALPGPLASGSVNPSVKLLDVTQTTFPSTSDIKDTGIDAHWQFEPDERLYDHDISIPTQTVLLWTSLLGDWPDHFLSNHGPYVELEIYQRSKRCFFTRDRALLNQSSAILFHIPDFLFHDLPRTRHPWQRWIWYLHESPIHAHFTGNHWTLADSFKFNWTMTYAKSSDVYHPYGHLRRSKKPMNLTAHNLKIQGFANSYKSRPFDAVWIVSNCGGITVNKYGSCGIRGIDEEFLEKGERQFYSQYRFVLALENSLCDDYITEKAFHAFYANFIAGAIPILYSAGNFSDFFPAGSYINLSSFRNLEDFVALLRRISSAPPDSPELLSYYDWQREINPAYAPFYELTDNVTDRYELYYTKRAGWRNLCKKLWDEDTGGGQKPSFATSVVDNLKSRLGKCYEADLSILGDSSLPKQLTTVK